MTTSLISREPFGTSICSLHVLDTCTVYYELDDAGVASCRVFDARAELPSVDVVIERSAACEAGDLDSSWPAERIAVGTDIVLGDRRIKPWGLVARADVDLPARCDTSMLLSVQRSPFALRPLDVAVTVVGAKLASTAAPSGQFEADLVVGCEWGQMVNWLARPEMLFADAFPGVVNMHGLVANLSLFEGLVFDRVARGGDTWPSIGVWGERWSSGAVRRDLAAVGPMLAQHLAID